MEKNYLSFSSSEMNINELHNFLTKAMNTGTESFHQTVKWFQETFRIHCIE